MNSKGLGELGETIARNYLIKKGYKILDLNFETSFWGRKFGEIDIIARKKKGLFNSSKKNPFCFIEVKTIFGDSGFSPEDKVNFKKQKNLKKMAEIYLINKKIPLNTAYQIDVITVRINPPTLEPKISHFENTLEG